METSRRKDSQCEGEAKRSRAREMLFNFFSSMHLSHGATLAIVIVQSATALRKDVKKKERERGGEKKRERTRKSMITGGT